MDKTFSNNYKCPTSNKIRIFQVFFTHLWMLSKNVVLSLTFDQGLPSLGSFVKRNMQTFIPRPLLMLQVETAHTEFNAAQLFAYICMNESNEWTELHEPAKLPGDVHIHYLWKYSFSRTGSKTNELLFWIKVFWKLGYLPNFQTPWSAFKFIWRENYGSKN